MINKTEHLLIILSEECAELSKNVSKALRFGLEDKEPNQDLTNQEKIVSEFNDLYSVMMMIVEDVGIPNILTIEAINKKKEKVLKYMKYAEEHGKVDLK